MSAYVNVCLFHKISVYEMSFHGMLIYEMPVRNEMTFHEMSVFEMSVY